MTSHAQSHTPQAQHADSETHPESAKEISLALSAMSARRRPRGSATGAAALYARVSPEAKTLSSTVAARLGVSEAEFVEELLLFAETTLDARGVPDWWAKPIPMPLDSLTAEEGDRAAS